MNIFNYLRLLNQLQAQGHQTDIRSSFDDSSAPLLQHDDRENQFSTGSIQFDLE
jgi:V-type H+-transporting ATPase subunit a